MQHIIINRGVAACGKSTWTAAFLKQHRDYVVVSRDGIRSMLMDHSNSPQTEKIVTKLYDKVLREALLNKYNIIIDNTHIKPAYISDALKVIESINPEANVELKQFDYDLETCIERDSKRDRVVGREIIEKMDRNLRQNPQKNIERLINEWKAKVRSKPKRLAVEYNGTLPDCILIDIDGTVAHNNNGRGYYEWNRVGEDDPDDMVINMINMLRLYSEQYQPDMKFIFVSGRDAICRKETEEWLELNNLTADYLFMRQEQDSRPDTVIKKEIYETHIKDKFNVVAVFDDRRAVSIQWYEMGLPLFRVGHPDNNF